MAQFLPARAEQVLQLGIVQLVLSKGLESVSKCFKFSSRSPYDHDGEPTVSKRVVVLSTGSLGEA